MVVYFCKLNCSVQRIFAQNASLTVRKESVNVRYRSKKKLFGLSSVEYKCLNLARVLFTLDVKSFGSLPGPPSPKTTPSAKTAHATKCQLRNDADKKKNWLFKSAWDAKHTPAWGETSHSLALSFASGPLFDWEARQRLWSADSFRCCLRGGGGIYPAACYTTHRTHSHTVQSDAGDEATRLWYARILLPTLRVSSEDLRLFILSRGKKALTVWRIWVLALFTPTHVFLDHFHENWVMITSPTVLRNSTNPAWESGSAAEQGAVKIRQLFFHNSVSPGDPSRQASRLPLKVLKMLTARGGHILHPEYLQPLPSTPISPIEVRTNTFWRKRLRTRASFR